MRRIFFGNAARRFNGAGKTIFAREFLLKDARIVHFANADLIAGGLSPTPLGNDLLTLS